MQGRRLKNEDETHSGSISQIVLSRFFNGEEPDARAL